ncbi:MAG: hypothetical protein AAFQ14_03810, partial [Cyanobacteria bacterium J06621_12]
MEKDPAKKQCLNKITLHGELTKVKDTVPKHTSPLLFICIEVDVDAKQKLRREDETYINQKADRYY